MKKLCDMKKGETAEITGFSDNLTKCHSARFGICEGELIKCLANSVPVIIGKNHQTIAIGRKMSRKIEVKEVQKK